MVKHLDIEIRQYLLFDYGVNGFVGERLIVWCNGCFKGILFSETVEGSGFLGTRAVEHTLNGSDAVQGLVLHIVREYHQLGYVDESSELTVRETFVVHSPSLGNNTLVVVRFLHLNEAQRQTIHEKGDVWTKFILSILTSKFGSAVICVVVGILEIYELCRSHRLQSLIELLSKVVVVQLLSYLLKCLMEERLLTGVQLFELSLKDFE